MRSPKRSFKDLVLCIQEPELGLRHIVASALMQITSHKPELANQDSYPKLKQQDITCLSHIAIHNQSLAEQVIHYIRIDQLLKNLKDADKGVRINLAKYIKNIVKHKTESAKYICKDNGKSSLFEYIKNNEGSAREPSLMAISCLIMNLGPNSNF